MKRWGRPTAVYRIYDRFGTLLYVGMTNDPFRRFEEHEEEKAWWRRDAASCDIEWFDHRSDAELEEEFVIWDERPIHNRLRPLDALYTPRPGFRLGELAHVSAGTDAWLQVLLTESDNEKGRQE